MADTRPFALFRVAAGPRIGYGHLRRATVLARALRRSCVLSLRGGAPAPATWAQAPATARSAIALRPRLLVLDDPRAEFALPWVHEARRRGVPTASLHDLGLASLPTDLAIDGSLPRGPRLREARGRLAGVGHAVLDVPRSAPRATRGAAGAPRVLVSFGGGDHRGLLPATIAALCRWLPGAHIIVPAGLGPVPFVLERPGGGRLDLVMAADGLGPLLRRVDLAILGGGLTLYEAAALGVPAIAVPVVAAQRPTVRAFARAGAALAVTDSGGCDDVGRRLARRAHRLWTDEPRRRLMAARGRQTVDGQGAARVARALHVLAGEHRG